MIPQHKRYGYSPIVGRRDYSWPDGKRLAFWIGTNVELYAFGAGIGNESRPDQHSEIVTNGNVLQVGV